jgi:hypothetical protein
MVFLYSVLSQLSSSLIENKSLSCYHFNDSLLAELTGFTHTRTKKNFCDFFNCLNKSDDLHDLSQEPGFIKYSFKTINQ